MNIHTVSKPQSDKDWHKKLLPCSRVKFIRLALHIPNRDCRGELINQSLWITKTVQLFSHHFGGAMVHNTNKGYWLNPKNRTLVEEETNIITGFVSNDDFTNFASTLRNHIMCFGSETDQGEVLLEVGDQMCLFRDFA